MIEEVCGWGGGGEKGARKMKLDIVGMVSSVLVSAALPFSFKTIGSKESYSQEWNPSK